MKSTDKTIFVEIMTGLGSAYRQDVTKAVLGVFWNATQDLTIEQFNLAVNKHVRKSKFFPTIAEIYEIAEQSSGNQHLCADEAWGVALQLANELIAVVVTNEIFTAWVEAKPVFDVGDEVGARMAFKATYNRIMGATQSPPVWRLTEGQDKAMTIAVVEKAAQMGRYLSPETYRRLQIAAPAGIGISGLIESAEKSVKTGDKASSDVTQKAIDNLKEILAKGADPDQEAKRREFERRKFEQHRQRELDRLAEYERLIKAAPVIPVPTVGGES